MEQAVEVCISSSSNPWLSANITRHTRSLQPAGPKERLLSRLRVVDLMKQVHALRHSTIRSPSLKSSAPSISTDVSGKAATPQ